MKNLVFLFIGFVLTVCIPYTFSFDHSLYRTVTRLKNNILADVLASRTTNWNFGNKPRAVIALYLADESFFNSESLISDIIKKELQLEIAEKLLTRHKHAISAGRFALYINALMAVCEDPHDFFKINIVKNMKHSHLRSTYEESLKTLTLCNAGHPLSNSNILTLKNFLENTTSSFHANIDAKAFAIMALACSNHLYSDINETSPRYEPIEKLKKLQGDDGSFGNLHTTALVIQALFAAGDFGNEWNLPQAITYIKSQYENDNFQPNLLAHFFVLPALNFKSMVDLNRKNVQCSINNDQSMEQSLNDEHNELWFVGLADNNDPVNAVTLSLKCDDCEFRNSSISTVVMIKDGESLLHVMEHAVLTGDDRFQFSVKNTSAGLMVESVSGFANSNHDKTYWMIYRLEDTSQNLKSVDKDVAHIQPKNKEHYILWYKKI